jgi:hypothetical protein
MFVAAPVLHESANYFTGA